MLTRLVLTVGVSQAIPLRLSVGVIVQFRREVKGDLPLPHSLHFVRVTIMLSFDPVVVNHILGICRERRPQIKVQDPALLHLSL